MASQATQYAATSPSAANVATDAPLALPPHEGLVDLGMLTLIRSDPAQALQMEGGPFSKLQVAYHCLLPSLAECCTGKCGVYHAPRSGYPQIVNIVLISCVYFQMLGVMY